MTGWGRSVLAGASLGWAAWLVGTGPLDPDHWVVTGYLCAGAAWLTRSALRDRCVIPR